MPSPVRAYTDPDGVGWLVLDNGAQVRLPAGGGAGGGQGPEGPEGPAGPGGPEGPAGPGRTVTRSELPPLGPVEGDIWIRDYPTEVDVAPADMLTNAANWTWAGFGYEPGLSIVAEAGGMRISWDPTKAAQFPGAFMPLVVGEAYRFEVDLQVSADSGPVNIGQYFVNTTAHVQPGQTGHLTLGVPYQSGQSSFLGVLCEVVAAGGGSVLVSSFHVWQATTAPVSYAFDDVNGWIRLAPPITGGMDVAQADDRYVNVEGDTMTGPLTVQGDVVGTYLASTYGADMGGFRVTGVADPVDAADAATKAYVDAQAGVQTGWLNAALTNGWVASYMKYRRNTAGMLICQGTITSGTVGASIAAFTLPTGMRPAFTNEFITPCSGGHARITVQASGAVCVTQLLAGTNTWVAIDFSLDTTA